MANTRTASCTLKNESSHKLTRVDDQFQVTLGQWAKEGGVELKPPKEIAPGASGTWRTESSPSSSTDVSKMGTSGSALYTYEKDGTKFEVTWAAPVAGTNTWSQIHRKQGGATDEGGSCSGDQKNDATFTFIFKPSDVQAASNNRAPSVPPPPPSGTTINAQATCGKTTHISPPEGSKDVMIVPKKGTFKEGQSKGEHAIFEHGYRFAQQWRDKDKAHRAIVEVPVKLARRSNVTFEDFKKAMIEAAQLAKSGEIILMTGHGTGTGHNYGLSNSMMDTVPEEESDSTKHEETLNTDNMVNIKDVTTMETLPTGEKVIKPKPPHSKETIEKMNQPHKYLAMMKIGEAFKRNGVRKFTALTCNAGKDRAFCEAIANVLGVEFQAYQYLVTTVETTVAVNGKATRLIQVWMTKDAESKEKSRPKATDQNHPSLYEIPNDTAKSFCPTQP